MDNNSPNSKKKAISKEKTGEKNYCDGKGVLITILRGMGKTEFFERHQNQSRKGEGIVKNKLSEIEGEYQ